MRLRGFGIIVALLMALTVPVLFGQETTAGIQGVVRDTSGAVIPQANVEVSSPALIGVKKMDTEQGAYRFVNLPPGMYTLTVTAAGFRTAKKTDIQLMVGHLPTVDITLEIGTITETVEVSAEAALIDPSQSKVQTNVTAQALMDLPTQSLSYQSVIQFAPGARYEPLQNDSRGVNNGFQINGASNSENSYLVDGQETASIYDGRANANVPMDFIEEVQVKSSGFEAEYGGALGGVVNVISKRGSNDWHGSAFLYYGSDQLNAGGGSINGIMPAQSGPNASLIRNPSYPANFGGAPRLDQPYEYYTPVKDHNRTLDPGFTLGGSLIKDRLWTFVSAAPDFVAIGRPVNVTYANTGLRTFNQSINTYYSLARLDYLVTNKIRVYGSWQYNYQRAQGTSLPYADDIHGQLNGFAGNNPDNYNNGIGQVTPNILYNTGADITISPTLVATTRFSYWAFMANAESRGLPTGIRYLYNDTNYNYSTTIPGLASTQPLDKSTTLGQAFPGGVQSAGYSNIGINQQTAFDWWRRYSFNQDLGWFKAGWGGRHNFKFGYAFNHGTNDTFSTYYNTSQVYVAYNQQYVPNSQIGIANCKTIVAQNLQNYNNPGGNADGTGCQGLWGTVNLRDLIGAVGKVGGWNHSFYAQDAWTIGKYLTLNVGVRLDKESLPSYDKTTGFQGIDFGWGQKIAPRLGASYDVLHNGKLKVYGSFGYFYDIMKYNLPQGSFGGAYWHDCVYALDTANYTGIIPQRDSAGHYCPLGGGNTPALGAVPGARFIENYDYREPANDPNQIGSLGKTGLIDPNLAPMKQHVMVIGGAWEISKNLVFEPIYTRSRLDRTIEDAGVITPDGEVYYIVNPGFGVNATVPSCPTCPPNPKAIRRYDGLELRLTKRFSDQWFGAFSYTYSSNTGNYGGLTSTDISDSQGRNGANTDRAFDEPFMSFDANGRAIDGPQPTDRPNAVKANIAYSPHFRKYRLQPTIGLFQTFYSGTPLSSYMSVWGAPVFVEGRGNFVNVTRDPSTGNWVKGNVNNDARTPHFSQSDLSVSQDFHVSKSNERMIARVGVDCINCFNQHHVTIINQNLIRTGAINPYQCGASGVSCSTVTDQNAGFNYIQVLKGYDYMGLANSQARTLSSLYGLPQGWQTPRSLRIQVRFTF